MLRNVVCATDFSEASEKAVLWTRYLAERTGANVTLVHVVETSFGVAGASTSADEERAAGRAELEKVRGSFAGEPAVKLLEGDPARAIAAFTRSQDTDLLVVGNHAYKGLTKWLHGSVSDETLHAVECPVLRC